MFPAASKVSATGRIKLPPDEIVVCAPVSGSTPITPPLPPNAATSTTTIVPGMSGVATAGEAANAKKTNAIAAAVAKGLCSAVLLVGSVAPAQAIPFTTSAIAEAIRTKGPVGWQGVEAGIGPPLQLGIG